MPFFNRRSPHPPPAGLLIYFADLILRAGQLANVTTVTAAHVDGGGEVATVELKASKASPGEQVL